ncbi:MAG: bifunctional diaminohydroxyphosphoribosylaminopyrimidine deaminase/5-amino-6-(5-phosphoribosylamino)uracil reductase RibD [Bacteroidia bacterium]
MSSDEQYMHRCLELAVQGLGSVAPNPMVGSVIVYQGKIIGEGWHKQFGLEHAEVNAIDAVEDKELLKDACLYVNLEPCSHFGKTPPCADLILRMGIPEVVVGTVDTFAQVCRQGIEKLKKAGVTVRTGVLEPGCRELNRRFFTFHEKKRPYIILKWAQTADGYMDHIRAFGNGDQALQISSGPSQELLHQWRSEETAILVGTNTALLDNPRLTVRGRDGKNPLRIVLDPMNRIPASFHIKDGTTPTLILTSQPMGSSHNLNYETLSFQSETESLRELCTLLHERGIQSMIVEGGSRLLQSFFLAGLWDETRVFIASTLLNKGLRAPLFPDAPYTTYKSGEDELRIYRNQQ